MLQNENIAKNPHQILTSKPPNLTMQAQFDKIMSSLIIQDSLFNPESVGQFVKKNRLQKLSVKDIAKLYNQFNNRQRKRILVNHKIYQSQSKLRESQSEKYLKTRRNLRNINVVKSDGIKGRLKDEKAFSGQIQNLGEKQQEINHKFNNMSKKGSYQQHQYFGKQILKFQENKNSLSKQVKVRSEINNNKKVKKSLSANKYRQKKKKNQPSHFKKQEKGALQDWVKKMIDLEQLHKKQMINYKQLNSKEIKRLRKIHTIEEQRLKQQIIRVAQYFLNT